MNERGYGISAGISKDDIKNLDVDGKTTIGMHNKGHIKNGVTRSTLGVGSIIIGGVEANASNEVIGGVNRDIEKMEITTKDMVTGSMDAKVSMDNRVLSIKGRESIGKDFEMMKINSGVFANYSASLANKVTDKFYLKEVAQGVSMGATVLVSSYGGLMASVSADPNSKLYYQGREASKEEIRSIKIKICKTMYMFSQ